MSNTTFRGLDMTTLIGLGDLDLEVTGQLIESERAVLEDRLVEPRRLVPPVWGLVQVLMTPDVSALCVFGQGC